MAGLEQSFSSLHRMYTSVSVLVKTNESHVVLCNAFRIWKPSVPVSTPTGWTPLDLTYGSRNYLTLRFPALNPTKELQAARHTRLLQAQLTNKRIQTND
jgi:hypothetical protein